MYGHIWCVLWLLLSVSAASEIKAVSFNNELYESPWHCVCTALREGGCCVQEEGVGPASTASNRGWWDQAPCGHWCSSGRTNVPTSSVLCGDMVYLAWNGRGLTSVHLHLPLVTSLHLVQLLADPREQLLLYPGHFKAQDFDFQSNHVKSYRLLFLFFQEIYLISSQYPCLKSAATGMHPVPMHKHTEWSKEKWGWSKHFLIGAAVWSNENNKQSLGGAATCPGDCRKGRWERVLWCPGKDFKFLLKVCRADWIKIRLYQSVLYLCPVLPSCPQERPAICHQSCATAVVLSCFSWVMGNDV